MNVSILMCEEWNPSWARKTIVGKEEEGGGKKRRERSAVKTRQTPDKVLTFCPFHAKPDPKKTGAGGPKNNPKSAKHLLLTAGQKGQKQTPGERLWKCLQLIHIYWRRMHSILAFINCMLHKHFWYTKQSQQMIAITFPPKNPLTFIGFEL